MENQFNNIGLLKLVYKWKIHLLVVFASSIIISIFFSSSLFIKPLFKSEAIAYPQYLIPYSKESESEQMLQIMQSKDIKDSIIKKFGLLEHYKFKSMKLDYEDLLQKYKNNVKIKKTDLESIDIIVYDTDPQIACDMVNAILYFYNEKAKALQKMKYLEVIKYMKTEINNELVFLDSIDPNIGDKNPNLVNVPGLLSKATIPAYASQVNSKALKSIAQQKDRKSSLSSKLLLNESTFYLKLRNDYEDAVRSYNMSVSYASVITPPFVANHKSNTAMSVIVMLSALSALLLAILVIIFIEKFKQISSILKS
jgi:hypothetical protein